MATLEEAKYLITLARKSIRNYLRNGKPANATDAPDNLKKNLGVFVTLHEFENHELRGCIGYPIPVKPLADAVADCAVKSAFEDPRFQPVSSESELSDIVIEISVLTEPQVVRVKSPDEYPKKIKVGRDGLIARSGYNSGLLLPQVPLEWNWNEEEFLCHTCNKAGLSEDAWRKGGVEISSFSAQVFSEKSPEGKIEEQKMVGKC
ncbi:MAG: TIGR00296 family protein [Candidatus Micrarchaeota archaeon]